jgi:nucleoside-diphosphate-sugar epimerase
MKVLLTGATGFVGSHILDVLRSRGIETVLLLRAASNRQFIEPHLQQIEIRSGSIDDAPSLAAAARDVTHVIHCAGAVKALTSDGFYAVNEHGTRNLVAALNQRGGAIVRLVHISSLAVAGPTIPGRPLREEDPPQPVSEYGRSKLAGEHVVREECRCEFVILRPPAVYGPRDAEFLRLFKAVKSHLLPRFGGGRQALSFVEVGDLARAAVDCLAAPAAAGGTYFVAADESSTAGELADEIASVMQTWTLPLPLPTGVLWPVCVAQEWVSHLTGKPNVLNRQKYAELRAPAWLCDPGRLARETGVRCPTRLREGLARTLAWYREQGWL